MQETIYPYFINEKKRIAVDYKFSNKNFALPAWRDFINIFSRPLFTIIFRSQMVISVKYCFLTAERIFELQPYCVSCFYLAVQENHISLNFEHFLNIYYLMTH